MAKAAEKDLKKDLAGKYLTFFLENEVYGLEILKVQEIIGLMPVTRMPQTPSFMRGIINLRGKVIPVVDLRLKFGINAQDDTERTCIIVVQVIAGDSSVTMGLIVDEVSEVLDIESAQIEPPPRFSGSVNINFILGIGKIDQKVIMLLDANKILSEDEIELAGNYAD